MRALEVTDSAKNCLYNGVRALWQPLPRQPRVPRASLPNGTQLCRIRGDHRLHEEYIRRFQAGEPGMGEILCQVNYPMIAKIARCYHGGSEAIDLFQEGRIGLLEGCARYDFAKAVYPMAYLYPYIQAHVRRAVVDRGAVIRLTAKSRREIRKRVVFTFSEVYDDVHGDEVDRAMRTVDLEADQVDDKLAMLDVEAEYPSIVSHLLGQLSPIEQEVIHKRIVQEPQETLKEIGDSKGLSRERIRQIEARALNKLRQWGDELAEGRAWTFDQWIAAVAVGLRKKKRREQKKTGCDLNIGVRPPPSGSRGSEGNHLEHAPLA